MENTNTSQSLNIEKNQKILTGWENLSDFYEKTVEIYSLQGVIQCAVQSNMIEKDRVLEVACGPGKHSLCLAKNFLKKEGVLVSCDFTKNMVKKLQENYTDENEDYCLVKGNKFLGEKDKDYTQLEEGSSNKLKYSCDLEAIIKSQEPFRKLVYGCQANNELLPFPDASFGAYIANLSVMIVDNWVNQIKEAFRVLQNNSVAVFTIWGNREETLCFSLAETIFKNHISPEQFAEHKKIRTCFHLYENDKGEALKVNLGAAGFKGIKMWESAQHIMFRDGKEFYEKWGFRMNMQMEAFGITEQEKKDKIIQESIELYDKLSGSETSDLKTFQVTVVVAFKE